MSDRPLIIGGLVLFLGLVTFPVWYNVAAGTGARAPEVARPATEKACVAPRDYMRTSHMTLLVTWREDVVRRGDRGYVTYDGRHYEKNLTGTCLTCHDDKAKFCDRCHDYAGVSPTCTECHVTPVAPGSRLQAPGATRLQQKPSVAGLQSALSRLSEARSLKPGAIGR
jgi:hypothetical protein